MKDLTVLATQNDPFRVDTPAGHRDGAWLANTARDLGLGDRRIHLRGLHYMIIGQPKPDGTPYTNTDADWLWLSSKAGKAARWLGYLPFDQITDQRNAAPEVQVFTRPVPSSYLTTALDIEVPDIADLLPEVEVDDFTGAQPYKIVMFGEKSSLDSVLSPIAQSYAADLYLPTGEISDTLMYQMARIGAEDGRPMVVICFSDCDPAGWQMPVSIGRKLQALKALGAVHVPAQDGHGDRTSKSVEFGDLEFEVRRVALTPDQVGEYGLPSTPLKETERRADRWRDAMGVQQTEIDALATLRPDLLARIATAAIAPFYDRTLESRVRVAREAWRTEAQAVVDAQLNAEVSEAIRVEVANKIETVREQMDSVREALRIDSTAFHLPAIVIPEAELDAEAVHGFAITRLAVVLPRSVPRADHLQGV